MKARMQKTLYPKLMATPKEIGRKPNGMGRVQTFMWMCVNGVVSRMVPKIGTAVCGTACTVV